MRFLKLAGSVALIFLAASPILARESYLWVGAGTETPTAYTGDVGQEYTAGLAEHDGPLVLDVVNTFDPNDATPTVAGGNTFKTGVNTGATVITVLDDEYPGAYYAIYCGSVAGGFQSTITDGGNFVLNGDWAPTTVGDMLVLYCDAANHYYEVGRTYAATGPASFTTLGVSGKATFDGAVDLGDAAADTVEIAGTMDHATTGTWADSHATLYYATLVEPVTIADAAARVPIYTVTTGTHPKTIVLRGFAMLSEIADAAGKVITVRLYDALAAGNAISDLLTFTQGVEIVGAVKEFTIDAAFDNIALTDGIYVEVTTTSAAAGEAVVYVTVAGE